LEKSFQTFAQLVMENISNIFHICTAAIPTGEKSDKSKLGTPVY